MIEPEIIAQFIEQTDQQLHILHNLDSSYSDLLSTTSSIRDEASNTQFEDSINILSRWLYTVSTHIRRRIEKFEIHREHLIKWYYNGFLGSEDW